MKKTLILILGSFLFSLSANAQCIPPKYMRQSMANVLNKAVKVNEKFQLGFGSSIIVMGSYLKEGNSVSSQLQLNQNVNYAFIGGGDDDVTDLDIFVYDANGNEIAKDNANDNNPVVTYTPKRTATYKIKVVMYATTTSGSFCGLAVMSESGGYNIPVKNINTTINDLFEMMERLCSNAGVSRMSYASAQNQWALFGTILGEGASISIQNITLSGSRKSIFVGAGDQNVRDMDLYLLDNNGTTVLKSDEENDAYPVFFYNGYASSNYQLKMKNVSSSGKDCLIMSAILECDK